MWYSVARSIISHYWLFTAVVLAFTVWGAAIAPVWEWDVVLLLLLAIFLGLEGLHDVDLAEDTVAVNIDPNVQRVVGYLFLAAGAAVGVVVAAMTTWLFIGIAVIEIFLGLAYNEEWFNGVLHDLDKFGWFNFAFSWGTMPVVAGYFALAETITIPAVLWGAAAFGLSITVIYLFEIVKVPVLYDTLGVKHDREHQFDEQTALEMANTALLGLVFGAVASAAAFVAPLFL